MTIFVIFFVLPEVEIRLSAIQAAAAGLSLWGSAQVAEATRGAVQSIPREQHEAASALGFGWVGRHVFVIVPQALRRLLPPMVSLLVNVIQNSTLAGLIGAVELLFAAKIQVERIAGPPPAGLAQVHAVEIYGGLIIVFFAISFPLTRLAAYLEKRLALGGLGETWSVSPGRAGRRAAASSVAPIADGYWGSLRPCITTPIAPRRRATFAKPS